jgi:3-deoxy-7-phosphoheptulonate synthase
LIVMRVYFEKPRTTVGWKGFINDPLLDNSFRINEGLRMARQLLLDWPDAGAGRHRVPGPAQPAIHRRPGELGRHRRPHHRESQPPRAGIRPVSCPVGFKNGTDGGVQMAADAMVACRRRIPSSG